MKESIKTFIKEHKVALICFTISVIAITATVTYAIAFNVAMSNFNQKIAGVNERQSMFKKLSEVDQAVRQDYIGKIDEKVLQESLCNGYIDGLPDSYSFYMSEELYKMYSAIEAGKAFNIGVTIMENSSGQIEVIDVQDASPAQNAGIQKGDVLLKIDNVTIDSDSYKEALIRLTGTPGTVLNIQLLRNQDVARPETLKVSVTCAKTTIKNIGYSMINNKVGHISIYRFDDLILKNFEAAMADLNSQGAESYIIDLRNNFIGKMEYSAQVLDYLLPSGDLISILDKDGQQKLIYSSGASSVNSKFTVLINSNTSGAGEIFASAMKDYNAAKIIGERASGKTTSDKVVSLSDGSAVLLPVAHYVTKNSGILTGVGLIPDQVVTLSTTDRTLLDIGELALDKDIQVQEALKELLGDAYNQDSNKDESQQENEVESHVSEN